MYKIKLYKRIYEYTNICDSNPVRSNRTVIRVIRANWTKLFFSDFEVLRRLKKINIAFNQYVE